MAKNKKKECAVQTDMSDIRMMTYDGEVWYNAKDIENHLKSVIDGMVEVKGYAEKLNDTIKKRLK